MVISGSLLMVKYILEFQLHVVIIFHYYYLSLKSLTPKIDFMFIAYDPASQLVI